MFVENLLGYAWNPRSGVVEYAGKVTKSVGCWRTRSSVAPRRWLDRTMRVSTWLQRSGASGRTLR
ncbi:hypothetical protein [Paraburkholderia tagetis]|uniref:Uncharacterized protein n=1 Tax=Paraburkholderia tagetis TaxID=2913261 RepID=A0A9X2A1P7_9BURK|nr:hypothetical protein [Paraburkholderia tagetis]MCG5078066.1 hypothetical protein [Paraburkholderia tagetis]